MGITPPVKDGVVRITGHHSTEKDEQKEVVIRKDEFTGTRKLVTYVKRPDNGWKLEADVFGVLDSKGYIVNELVQSVNMLCMNSSCTLNLWLRRANKTFVIEPNPVACVMLGKLNGPPPGVAYDVGRLSIRENCSCPHCGMRFRIADGVWSVL